MGRSFKEFCDNFTGDSKKALHSLKESDTKYIEKRAAKYFKEEDLEAEGDIILDPDTYKKYLTK